MNDIVKIDDSENALTEAVFLRGDFSHFSPEQKARYIVSTCKSLGLNPLTRPIRFIRLNGQDVPYAVRDCADQLRKLNGVSIAVVSKEEKDGLLIVHVRATDKHGREDEDYGAVPMNDAIKGEARANAFLKAVTKAKRRVTLSICGLGFLDETEVEDVQRATIRRPAMGANPMLPAHNPATGEIADDFAGAMDHALGNGNGATQETKEDPEAESEAQEGGITEKVALCANIKALNNYWNTLSVDEQEANRDLFNDRQIELKTQK